MMDEQKPESPLSQPGVDRASSRPVMRRPSYLLLGVVAGVSLALDLGTKWWALRTLEKTLPSGETIPATKEITSWLSLVLARNRGGAWGLLQTANENIRRPFFLLISVLAIIFIVSLYRRVHPQQYALKWGLPLVLGGALGNLVDRIRYSWVVDFIDYRAGWVRHVNEVISKVWQAHGVTDHWPTFNVADIAICIGVGLMAIDMFTSRRIVRENSRRTAPRSSAPTERSSPPLGPTA